MRAHKQFLMVYPEIPDTYWSFHHALGIIGKRAVMPPLGLATVAADALPDIESSPIPRFEARHPSVLLPRWRRLTAPAFAGLESPIDDSLAAAGKQQNRKQDALTSVRHHPAQRYRGYRRVHYRVRQRPTRDLRPPDRVHSGARDTNGNDRSSDRRATSSAV